MNRKQFLAWCGAAGCGALVPPPAAVAADTKAVPPRDAEPARIGCETVRLELKHRWTIARGSADFKENVIVSYERGEIRGWGEAAHLTAAGQTAPQTRRDLEPLIPWYQRCDPWRFFELPDQAAQRAQTAAPARAALDLALLDWLGKSLERPVYQCFGLDPRKTVGTSFSIGLDSVEKMREKTREARSFPVLKVKLGGENDETIIQAIRAETDQPIRVDANEGWPEKETALRKIDWLEKRGVELVEQPMPRQCLEEMRWIKARTGMPLLADEAVHSARDLKDIPGAYTGVNIKLMKAGGWLESLRMLIVCRALGLDAMLGCMIESSLAITAAAHLQSLARWADLDGCLLIRNDPFRGAALHEGHWQLPVGPGWGVSPKSSP